MMLAKNCKEVKVKMILTEKVMNLSDLKPIKSEGMDLKQFHNKNVKIERARVVQVPSTFTPMAKGSTTEHQPQWVLKVESEVVASIGEGEEKIEFRASELFNLLQDDDGNLKGYPDNDKANIVKFMKDINANHPDEIVGKSATVKAYDKKQIVDNRERVRTYLGFKY